MERRNISRGGFERNRIIEIRRIRLGTQWLYIFERT